MKKTVYWPRILFIISIVTTLSACGGGGSESPAAPDVPKPVVPVKPVLTKPNYQGITTVSDILPQDSASLSFELTSALDFLNLLAFSGTVDHFLINPSEDASQIPNENSEIVCESGSVTTLENQDNDEVKVEYNNCVQDGIRLNGSLTVYLIKLRDAVLHDVDMVVDLTIEELSSNEEVVLSGYVKVREGVNNFETTATFHIMFQNELNEQIYFNGLRASINQHGDDYGIDYQGDVYFSDRGKLTLSTQDLFNSQELGQRLQVAGSNSILIDIYLQDRITIAFSEDTIPQTISLISPPDEIFDDTNMAPTAVISTASYTTDRNTEITLSSRGSSDPDYDVLSFSWDIISAPAGATWSISQTVDTAFSGDLPGSYTIKLVVDDNQLAAVETTRVITVEKGVPSGSISNLVDQLVIDGEFSAQIQMDNDQYDRPFEYRLAFGPAGMQVDQNGLITWNAHIPDFGVTTDVNFAVEVLNSDKNKRIFSSTAVHSGPNHKLTTLHTTDVFEQITFHTEQQTYRHTNNREHFTAFVNPVSSADIPFEYALNEADIIQSGWATVSIPDNFKYTAKYDVDSDGVADHFMTRFNDATNISDRYELWLMNGATKELTLFAAHQHDVWGTFVFKDMNKQVGVELLAYNQGAVVDTAVYSLENNALLYQTSQAHGELVGYCDFNGDGIDEVISESYIVDLVTDEQLTSLESYRQVEVFQSSDDNPCGLLINNYGELSLYKYQNSEFVELPFTLTTAGGGFSYFVGNFDDDTADELLYLYQDTNGNSNRVLVNFDDDSNPIEQPLSIANEVEFFHQNIISILDLDGDNIDEILYYNHAYPSNTTNLSAIKLSETTLITSYTGESNYTGPESSSMGGIANFQNEGVSTYYNSIYDTATLVSFSALTDPAETELSLGEVIGTEKTNEEVFYYAHRTFGANNRYEIIKYAENGSIIWQTEVSNSYRNYVIQDIDIALGLLVISVAGSNPHQVIINTENGSVLRESDTSGAHAFISPGISANTQIINGNMKEALAYSDGELSVLFAGLDGSIGIDLTRVDEYTSFIQYDDDPQLEVLIYYTGWSSDAQSFQQNYLILDSLTWTKEELNRGEQGFIPYQTLIPQQELVSCFDLDISCRNSLNRKDNSVEMIDKLSGSIVWRSPNFPVRVNDIKFDIGSDNHVRIAMTGSGIYIFE